jgi:hypothetical protein
MVPAIFRAVDTVGVTRQGADLAMSGQRDARIAGIQRYDRHGSLATQSSRWFHRTTRRNGKHGLSMRPPVVRCLPAPCRRRALHLRWRRPGQRDTGADGHGSAASSAICGWRSCGFRCAPGEGHRFDGLTVANSQHLHHRSGASRCRNVARWLPASSQLSVANRRAGCDVNRLSPARPRSAPPRAGWQGW